MADDTATKAKQIGRKKGAKGWKETEIDVLLDSVKIWKPVGQKMWEKVATDMYDEGYSRFAASAKKKIDRLMSICKPTGSSEIPRHVKRAKDLKEMIDSEECIGYVGLNGSSSSTSSDEEAPLKAAKLSDDDGKV